MRLTTMLVVAGDKRAAVDGIRGRIERATGQDEDVQCRRDREGIEGRCTQGVYEGVPLRWRRWGSYVRQPAVRADENLQTQTRRRGS
jgi:hypothetical protein